MTAPNNKEEKCCEVCYQKCVRGSCGRIDGTECGKDQGCRCECHYKGFKDCLDTKCPCHKAPVKEEHTHDFVFMHPTGKVMCIECGEPPPNDLTTPAPTQTLDTEKGIEEITAVFVECDSCASKPGTPPLCQGCLKNRSTMERVNRMYKTAAHDLIEAALTAERTRLHAAIEKEKVHGRIKNYDGNLLATASEHYNIAAETWAEIIRYEQGFNAALTRIQDLLSSNN